MLALLAEATLCDGVAVLERDGGKIRVIGSTTHEDFRGSFGKDKALARRFQAIDVMEPSLDETIQILQH